MKTRNILERRIEESYNRYKKLYREQADKGYSLEKMKSKKEYAAIYKENIGLGRKNIARDMVYDQRIFVQGEEQLEKAVEDLSKVYTDMTKTEIRNKLLKDSNTLDYKYKTKEGNIITERAYSKKQALYMNLKYLGISFFDEEEEVYY